MTDRRKFIAGCAAGMAVLAAPLRLSASTDTDLGLDVTAETFRAMIGQRFRCMTDLGYSVRLRLVEVRDGPIESGVEQFALVFKEGGASGPGTLSEGRYDVFKRQLGHMPLYLAPSDSRERHYVTYFGLLY
jgi:hypothetical protein